ncbi:MULTISPECIES: TFIIB-type zinc ribbon-containing protein [Pyrobaculum]|uniref:Zinc finger, TFIIB-type domain protein n=2 Tax=Pyrobaculum arsenaticum TaxID=121277 RepID=A4WMR1_PYRAR|nr:TFIIB-type zinc ribbon-containing protein [Pyrobaculum arsenaticum]ABP51678.1 Zinc finger, TFIIB-type domain protein [Pyrobaculum arsenaticum DSM 13514]MCY0890719.1 transcription initiation factor IIB family protein [Pyrobaculum arsenaticum]NYR15997.1 transcription initiation factor IIB family protein [Pyrobaculum arsenaticum]
MKYTYYTKNQIKYLFVMICPYCKSTNITLADGEYVCRDCGTVLGPEMLPPRLRQVPVPVHKGKIVLTILEKEDKTTIKKRYSELVEHYVAKIAAALARKDLEMVALEIFRNLDKRVYQGKTPKAIAAALVYLAAERAGIHIYKQTIARILGISKFTIRDTVTRLRGHVASINTSS